MHAAYFWDHRKWAVLSVNYIIINSDSRIIIVLCTQLLWMFYWIMEHEVLHIIIINSPFPVIPG